VKVGVNTLSILPGVTGGAETYLVGLLRGIAAVDSRNSYMLFVSPENKALFEKLGSRFDLITLPVRQRPSWRRVLYERVRFARAIFPLGVDVLFCPGNAAVPTNCCAQVLCVQSMLHSLAPQEVSLIRRLYFGRIVPWSVRRATKVIAVSEDVRRRVLALGNVPPDKVRVVYEGVDCSFRRPSEDEVLCQLRAVDLRLGFVLFVSTLKPYKNADKFLRAMALLRERLRDPKPIVIVGHDPLNLRRQLQSMAKESGIGPQVRFFGRVEHARLPYFYAGADLFVFPSSIETFGLPVLEAMACGAPVVGSDRMAVPEVVGDAGLCVNPDDIPALADAIYKVLSDDVLRDALRRKGYERVQQFTWGRAARATLEVFEEAHAIWQGTSAGHLRRFHEASPS
jgi:glycosyltransferase involved in cell wall biosynthesis